MVERHLNQPETGTSVVQADIEAYIMQQACDDLDKFEPLYVYYVTPIHRFCLNRVNSKQDAEDLIAQTFANALRNLHQYRGGSVAAWLFTIARNVIANHYRYENRRSQDEPVSFDLPDIQPTLFERLRRNQDRKAIVRIVSELPDSDQELLALRFGAELNSQEIGEILGESAPTVRKRLSRVIEKLRVLHKKDFE